MYTHKVTIYKISDDPVYYVVTVKRNGIPVGQISLYKSEIMDIESIKICKGKIIVFIKHQDLLIFGNANKSILRECKKAVAYLKLKLITEENIKAAAALKIEI